jgi:hypothetical protein
MNHVLAPIHIVVEKRVVGTTNMSIDAIPSAWLQGKVFQPCDGSRLLLGHVFVQPSSSIPPLEDFAMNPELPCG